MITVLSGGVGAARFLQGLVAIVPANEVTAVVNTGDDLVLHGLHISPDLDTVTYTLAGAINTETGWGLAGESWQAMSVLEKYGGQAWFRLGDRDLATHLHRTQRLAEGATLSEATAEIASAWGLALRVLPVSDDPLATMVTVAGDGEIGFQDYFVHRRHAVAVEKVRVEGADNARPAPGVLEAIQTADRVVIAPSNPIVSIGPILEVPGISDALARRRSDVTAVSPLVGGRALKGPADRMMAELGHDPSVAGVARLYRRVCSTLVIDAADADRAAAVEAEGVRPVVTTTVMSTPEVAASLARTVLSA